MTRQSTLALAAASLLASPALADSEVYCARHPLSPSCVVVVVPVTIPLSFALDVAVPRAPPRDAGAVGAGGIDADGGGGNPDPDPGGGGGGGGGPDDPGPGNPGNDKAVGRSGESPNGRDFGDGDRGRSDEAQ